MMERVVGAVRAFGGAEQSDDLTLVLVRARLERVRALTSGASAARHPDRHHRARHEGKPEEADHRHADEPVRLHAEGHGR